MSEATNELIFATLFEIDEQMARIETVIQQALCEKASPGDKRRTLRAKIRMSVSRLQHARRRGVVTRLSGV